MSGRASCVSHSCVCSSLVGVRMGVVFTVYSLCFFLCSSGSPSKTGGYQALGTVFDCVEMTPGQVVPQTFGLLVK